MNSVAATLQAIETESKGGWPVLMPTKKEQANQSLVAPCVPVVANGTSTAKTASNADQLPDILATMSITNPSSSVVSSSSSYVTEVSSKSQPNTATTETSSDVPVNKSEEPKDLLSQFDPLLS